MPRRSLEGVNIVAISSNDVETFPDDSFPKMKELAGKYGFSFPYLFDENQEIAKAYGAVCTPDFFGLNADSFIEYRGGLDEGKKDPPRPARSASFSTR